MKIAAFDTSSPSGSIAILDDNRLVAELTVGSVGVHSEWLLRSYDFVLKESGLAPDGIDLFAVGVGPGSFTGLRIGLSTVKGLAWATGRRVVGISTLAALAMNLRTSNMAVCPLLDARKGEVYAAVYGFNAEAASVIIEEAALTPEELFKRIDEAKLATSVIFLGVGLGVYEEAVRTNLPGVKIAPDALWNVRASNVGLLALEAAGAAVEPHALTPVYLRKSEVEIKAGGG